MRRIAQALAVITILAASATPASPATAKQPRWLRHAPALVRQQYWIHSRYTWCLHEVIEGSETVELRKCRGRIKGGPWFTRDGANQRRRASTN